MKRFTLSATACLLAGALQAQNTSAPTLTLPPPVKSQKDGMAAAAEMLKGLLGSTNKPLAGLGKPVADLRELKALLPAEVCGLRRTGARAEKTGAFGASVAQARGSYGDGDGARFEIKITDLAAMGPFGALAGMGWVSAEVESEGDDGYERTTKYGAHKALEKYSSAAKSGSATVVVADRFIVEIQGQGIQADQLKAAATALDLQALENLAKRPQAE